MKKIHKNWEPCPRCESKKVQTRSNGFYFLMGFITMSFSLWLLIIPPVGIVGMLIGFSLMAASPFLPKTCICQDCKFSWKYPYKEEQSDK